MPHPIDVGNGIALIVPNKLDKEQVALYYKVVKLFGPPGNTQPVPISNDKGEPQSVLVTGRQIKQGDKTSHVYMISLLRPLVLNELSKIERALEEFMKGMEFELESIDDLHKETYRDEPVTVDPGTYRELCTKLAKHNHDLWVQSKTSSGWRWGPELVLDKKTHPMLLPWDQLPQEYRRVDYSILPKVLEFLNQEGYAVAPKEAVDPEHALKLDPNELLK